jgi:hypothetical protein
MEFYAKAPWPLGDADKAMEQAAEIARRDPKRGAAAYRDAGGIFEKRGPRRACARRRSASAKARPRAGRSDTIPLWPASRSRTISRTSSARPSAGLGISDSDLAPGRR